MATKKTSKRKGAPNKGGRPPVPDPRKNLSLRLTREERDLLREKADAVGVPQTIYARIALRRMLGLNEELV